MLLRADPETSEEMWLINPFNGETLDEHTTEVWLKGNIGPVAELILWNLVEADNAEVIRKLLDTLKSLMEGGRWSWPCAPAKRCCSFNRKIRMRSATRG